jgi:hypothetical protein
MNSIAGEQAGTYYLQITENDGCVRRDSVELIVHPRPTLSIETNSPVCAGETLMLNGVGGNPVRWEIEYSDTTLNGYNSYGNSDEFFFNVSFVFNNTRLKFIAKYSIELGI